MALMKEEKAKLRAEILKKAKNSSPIPSYDTEENLNEQDFDLDVQLRIPTSEGGSEIQYFKDVITEIEEMNLKEAVERQALNKQTPWVELTDRRSMMCGSHHDSYERRIVELPTWLKSLAGQLECFYNTSQPVNHVLINKYEENGGIAHHTDGPGYRDIVAILSLGGPVLLSFKERLKTEEIGLRRAAIVHSVVMQPRSLLVFSGSIYSELLHGVECGGEDVVDDTTLNAEEAGLEKGDVVVRQPRVSLTLRHFY